MIVRIGFVPFGDEFFTGLADVLAVDDRAGENTRDVQTVSEGWIGSKRD